VEPATHYLLRVLRAYKVRATFFVLGHVADHHPALIEAIAADGHELGIHGYAHRFVHKLTPAEFDAELARSIDALVRITGEPPTGHRAPYFSLNAATPWAFACLERHGLVYDSSVFPVRNPLYGFPGAPRRPYRVPGHRLWELPATTVRWAGVPWPVAGGFYNRALPYALTRAALRRLNRAGEPAMLYIHPWELDLDQRYTQVTLRERVTHYYGRAGLAAKLEQLFTDFRFGPMCDLVAELEQTAPEPVYTATPGAQERQLPV
jgi:polysaccharide deacetylase family protein (PEP-CTERM system associated)